MQILALVPLAGANDRRGMPAGGSASSFPAIPLLSVLLSEKSGEEASCRQMSAMRVWEDAFRKAQEVHCHIVMEWFGLERPLQPSLFYPTARAGTPSTRSGCSEPNPTWPGTFPGMGQPEPLQSQRQFLPIFLIISRFVIVEPAKHFVQITLNYWQVVIIL